MTGGGFSLLSVGLGSFPGLNVGQLPPRHLRRQLHRGGKSVTVDPAPDCGAVDSEVRGKDVVRYIGGVFTVYLGFRHLSIPLDSAEDRPVFGDIQRVSMGCTEVQI